MYKHYYIKKYCDCRSLHQYELLFVAHHLHPYIDDLEHTYTLIQTTPNVFPLSNKALSLVVMISSERLACLCCKYEVLYYSSVYNTHHYRINAGSLSTTLTNISLIFCSPEIIAIVARVRLMRTIPGLDIQLYSLYGLAFEDHSEFIV